MLPYIWFVNLGLHGGTGFVGESNLVGVISLVAKVCRNNLSSMGVTPFRHSTLLHGAYWLG